VFRKGKIKNDDIEGSYSWHPPIFCVAGGRKMLSTISIVIPGVRKAGLALANAEAIAGRRGSRQTNV
jgi:hypothetical protein